MGGVAGGCEGRGGCGGQRHKGKKELSRYNFPRTVVAQVPESPVGTSGKVVETAGQREHIIEQRSESAFMQR